MRLCLLLIISLGCDDAAPSQGTVDAGLAADVLPDSAPPDAELSDGARHGQVEGDAAADAAADAAPDVGPDATPADADAPPPGHRIQHQALLLFGSTAMSEDHDLHSTGTTGWAQGASEAHRLVGRLSP